MSDQPFLPGDIVTRDQTECFVDLLTTHWGEFRVPKNAWGSPVRGSTFEFNGRTWRIDTEAVDAGDAWEFEATDVDSIYGVAK